MYLYIIKLVFIFIITIIVSLCMVSIAFNIFKTNYNKVVNNKEILYMYVLRNKRINYLSLKEFLKGNLAFILIPFLNCIYALYLYENVKVISKKDIFNRFLNNELFLYDFKMFYYTSFDVQSMLSSYKDTYLDALSNKINLNNKLLKETTMKYDLLPLDKLPDLAINDFDLLVLIFKDLHEYNYLFIENIKSENIFDKEKFAVDELFNKFLFIQSNIISNINKLDKNNFIVQ